MSIEDVDYMKQNSIKENYTFIVDSKFRDQTVYPEPNNYVVNFDIPFKNVFGVEILDVSIPKTMYNIDKDSNQLIMYINTTKKQILNLNDMAIGLQWEKKENINDPTTDIEINEPNKYVLSDKLRTTTQLDSFVQYNISNLNKYNYVEVVNLQNWKINDTININNTNYVPFFNPKLSEDLKTKNEFTNNEIDLYNLNNLRTYNTIPVIDGENFYLEWYNSGDTLFDNNYGLEWEYIGTNLPKNGNNIDNEVLKNYISSGKLSLNFEEFEKLNIDITNKNNYIEINNNYYKPKTNLNIGSKWIDHEYTDNKKLYVNTDLELDIKRKIYLQERLNYTNEELNNFNFDFNIQINSYIKVYTGLKWERASSSRLNGYTLLKNDKLDKYIINFLNTNNSTYKLTIDIKEFNTFGIDTDSINEKLYVIIYGNYWIIEANYIIPNGLITVNNNLKRLWLNNNNLYNYMLLNFSNTNKNDIITIPLNEWETFNINPNELLSYTCILINNNYYKIKPTKFYTTNIFYYYPTDTLNINNQNDYENLLELFFEKFIIEIPIGNYTLNKLIIGLNSEFRNNINLEVNTRNNAKNENFLNNIDNYELGVTCSGNTTPADIQNILKFESNRAMIFDMNNSTINKTLGFYSKVSNDSSFINSFKYLNINIIENYEKFYHSVENSNKHIIISPGIVYLIGSEYIILKCPEIEEHLYGSLSYTKNTIGLAKIRISNWGLNEESTSYLKLQLREFHPIGKLTKMTLKFENADGSLYNFRGVNHNIVFAVHYYSAKQKKVFEKSVINPDYKMNFIEYKYSHDDIEEESDVDDEENYSKINIENYKIMENKYGGDKYTNGYELDYNKIKDELYNNIYKSESDSDL